VSPVNYELVSYIPEDDILHSHRRDTLNSYTRNLGYISWLLRWDMASVRIKYEAVPLRTGARSLVRLMFITDLRLTLPSAVRKTQCSVLHFIPSEL
jgi:hypothetical protein